jgi:ParB/RepB/Spo0J family partition protein
VTNQLIKLKPDQLLTHPRNMRKFYPANQVREMANSIMAAKGVIEPLIITKGPEHKWYVIDGNMRLAGARMLEGKCPSLDCKVVDQDEADQLLSMIITNQVRYDVDPVSEALHYKALRDEGLSIRDISKRTGVYEARIHNRIILADLDEQIQKLIVEGKLPASPEAAKALLRLDPEMRVKLAMRLSNNPNTKISTIIKACERLLEDQAPSKKLKHPAAELSGATQNKGVSDFKAIRKAVKKVCEKCNQVEESLREGDEPAWSIVVHAANENCNCCELKEVQRICAMCPAVALLNNLIMLKRKDDAGER